MNTRSATIQYFPTATHRVTVLNKRDETTGCAHLKVEFKKGKSPMRDGAEEDVGCFLTNTELRDMMVVHHGSERLKWSLRRRPGRGRGRRGRGRGRGRRSKHSDPRMTFDGF